MTPKQKEVAALYDQRDALQEEVIHLKDCVRRIADELEYEKQENAKLGVWLKAALEKQTALTSELTKLRSSSFVTAVPAAQYERLCKAGDDLADTINHEHKRNWEAFGNEGDPPLRQCVKNWLSAKKGKDAK